MFIAAMLASAAVCDDIKEVIKAGLYEIPKKSRLFYEVQNIIELYDKGESVEYCIQQVHNKYNENTAYGWCHVISNAMIVVISLLYGGMCYDKSICIAVQACFDTDCNGATVGSIIGMMIGAKNIPDKWTKVINGKLNTSIFGIGAVSVSELTEITLKHIDLNL
jgi:ADP-ribosylglycohydrolase